MNDVSLVFAGGGIWPPVQSNLILGTASFQLGEACCVHDKDGECIYVLSDANGKQAYVVFSNSSNVLQFYPLCLRWQPSGRGNLSSGEIRCMHSVEGTLLIGGLGGELAVYSMTSIMKLKKKGEHEDGAKPPLRAHVVLSLPVSIPILQIACSTARVLQSCSSSPRPSRNYAPSILYLMLANKEILSCPWSSILDSVGAASGDGVGGEPRVTSLPTFIPWSLNGTQNALSVLCPTNPLPSSLFHPSFLSRSTGTPVFYGNALWPDDAGSGSDGREEGFDTVLTGGRFPTLASYQVPLQPPSAGLSHLAASVGYALRKTLEGFSWARGWLSLSGASDALGGPVDSLAEEDEATGTPPAVKSSNNRGGTGEKPHPVDSCEEGLASVSSQQSGAVLLSLEPLPPRHTISPEFTVSDGERHIEKNRLVCDPTGRWVLWGDSWGRVALVDAGDLTLLRLWKGYRDAELGWIEWQWREEPSHHTHATTTAAARASMCPVILAPRRGTVEIWRPRAGPRLAQFKVPPSTSLIYSLRWGTGTRATAFPSPQCSFLFRGGAGGGRLEVHTLWAAQPPSAAAAEAGRKESPPNPI